MRTSILVCSLITAGTVTASILSTTVGADIPDPNLLAFENASGQLRTFNERGAIDLTNPFFQDLGTNGRRCVSCHQPEAAWSITPDNVRTRFVATAGADPIFRSNDGSNCEGIDAIDGDQAVAYSLLLSKGLIRVGIDVPADAEFQVLSVDDPYGGGAPLQRVSMYRRPLPSTNLRFLSAVMWDGRESSSTTTITQDLAQQANAATRGHAQSARDLTPQERQQIVAFEARLFTAQGLDHDAGTLSAQGAGGGPLRLSQEPFFIGINDPVGMNPAGTVFTSNAFTLFDGWSRLKSADRDPFTELRLAIARGQQIFNTHTFTIEGVNGLNGETFPSGVRVPESLPGTCTVCHDSPNVGNHSVKAPLDIGLTSASRRTSDLPLYTLINLATGQMIETTDPGRAMITGKWKDIGKFKGPILRALAARAPYFHNGSAATLGDVVEFYNERFQMELTPQERADLVAFLRAL
jgi:cytochrome c peroxidase